MRAALLGFATTTLLTGLCATALATPIPGSGSIAAVHTRWDTNQHVYLAQTNGDIREIYFRDQSSAPSKFVSSDVIANHAGVVAISAFSTEIQFPGYGTRDRIHVLAATAAGDIYDTYYTPGLGLHDSLLTHLDTSSGATVTGIAAWANDLNHQNVAILTSDGSLYHVDYVDVSPPTQAPTFVGPTSATAFTGFSDLGYNVHGAVHNHIIILDTDLIDISWPNGDEPDLSNTMTKVTTLESGGPTFQNYTAISGFAFVYNVHTGWHTTYNQIALLGQPAPTSAATVDMITYMNSADDEFSAATLANLASPTGPFSAIVAYPEGTWTNGFMPRHVVYVTPAGVLVDLNNANTSGSWSPYSLGTF
jgi:hypothetical protein